MDEDVEQYEPTIHILSDPKANAQETNTVNNGPIITLTLQQLEALSAMMSGSPVKIEREFLENIRAKMQQQELTEMVFGGHNASSILSLLFFHNFLFFVLFLFLRVSLWIIYAHKRDKWRKFPFLLYLLFS